MPIAESFLITIAPQQFRSRVLSLFYFGGAELSGILATLVGSFMDRFGFSYTLFMAYKAPATKRIWVTLVELVTAAILVRKDC